MTDLRLLIDTDPGVDDGIALALALSHSGVQVEAITVVRGNTTLANSVRAARLVMECRGADTPVYAGADAPLRRAPPERASWLHGADGFGDLGREPHQATADSGVASEQIVARVMAEPGAITIVALGPLTNLAFALAREPRIAAAARGLVVMGGNTRPGVAAEFNFRTDPEATARVLAAGFDLTIVGLELTGGACRLTEEDRILFADRATPAGALMSDLLAYRLATLNHRPPPPGERGATCPDVVAIAVAINPALLLETLMADVKVDTGDTASAGTVTIDPCGSTRQGKTTRVGLAVDSAVLRRLLSGAGTSSQRRD